MKKERIGALSIGLLLALCITTAPSATPQSANKPAAPDDTRFMNLRIPHPNRAALKSGERRDPERDNANARRLWFLQRMAGYGGRDYIRHVMREADKQRLVFARQNGGASAPVQRKWSSIGPTGDYFIQNFFTLKENDSGRARTIIPHPTDPNTLYYLNSGGGLWKTKDFLSAHPHWVSTTDNLITTSGGSFALGSNPDTIYLGLGDPFASPFLVAGAMVKSTDGGNTWQPFVGLPADTIMDVKVDTSGPQDIVLVATDTGLFRSTDGGATYVQTASTNPTDPFFGNELWTLVKTSAGWLASAESLAFLAAGQFGLGEPVGVNGSLWISTDQGATWNPIPNGGNVYTGAGRTTLAVGQPGDSVVYAFAAQAGDPDQLDLFRSNDGGLNWTALGLPGKTPVNPNPDQPNMDLMHRQAFYNHMILVDPHDPNRNTVFLGGDLSTAKTTDGGNTWTVTTNWLAQFELPYVHADCHAAAILNVGKEHSLLFGTDGGLYLGTADAKHWNSHKQEGIVSSLIYTVVGNPQTPFNSLIGLQDDGSRVRVHNAIWNQTLGGDGFGTGWSQANNAISVATVEFENVFFSTVNPALDQNDWNSSNGLDPNDANFATPVDTPAPTADPTGLVFFTSSFSKVYESIDGAANFNLIGQGSCMTPGVNTNPCGGSNFVHNPRAVLHTVASSPVDLLHLAIPGTSGTAIISTDGGLTWTEYPLNSLVPGYASFNAGAAWANNNLVYFHSEAPILGATHVAKGVANGSGGFNFSAPANAGLPDVPVDRLLVDPRDPSGNTLYAATWIGVFKSTDGANSWTQLGVGLPAVTVTDLYLPPNGSFLRVSTYGRGVWDLPKP